MGNDLIQGLNFYTLWHTGLIIAMAPANLKDGEHHYMLLSMVKADDEPSCIPAPQSWDGIPSLCAPYACTLLGTANSLCIKRLKSIEKGGRLIFQIIATRISLAAFSTSSNKTSSRNDGSIHLLALYYTYKGNTFHSIIESAVF